MQVPVGVKQIEVLSYYKIRLILFPKWVCETDTFNLSSIVVLL